MNTEVGITRSHLALILSRHVSGTRTERLKAAWSIVRDIEACAKPSDGILADNLGICPKCLEPGWLIAESGAIERCMNCGTEWLVLEDERSGK